MSILPAVGVFSLCLLWGLEQSLRLKKREQLLNELKTMVTEFSVAMRCTAPTLDELMMHCGGVFGQLLREELSCAADVRAAWERALTRLSRCTFCQPQEEAVLRQLGQELGTCAAQGQLSLLEMHGEKLSALLQGAADEHRTKGKLFRSVGTLTGLAAAILIL